MTDDDLGHASTVAEQLRLAEENGNLPEELEDEEDDQENSEEYWLVYLYDFDDHGEMVWTPVGLVEDRETWIDWWEQVINGEIDLPDWYDGWWCADRPVSVGLPRGDQNGG
ncbi:hypothetical protein U4E84_09665 [Halorubrum sp. AD140]|uniref:hypothetical protein n=1 Tax=Halorubrum sp. AD140 TaxID=3050073 RepID=UPI002ACC53B4|nr:hypothetical protein [Halorubrum sp. AD140]MDZ5811610.1 hypothetical protein [Halorubrum sp. AD140]